MNLINESQIFETWAPMIEEKTGITESAKLKWMTKYAHFHSLNEGFTYPQAALLNTPGMGNVATGAVAGGANTFYNGATGSGDKFPSLLPLAIQVAARTVGFDIVSVVPMNGPAGVLTYLDYVYAGGRDPRATNAPGSKAEKPLLFKLQKSGLGNDATERNANYAAVTALAAGTKLVFSATGATVAALLVEYVGKSRVDGAVIFKVVAEGTTTAAGVADFSTGVWPAQPQGITLADVLDGSASLYGTLTITGYNVTASTIVGATGDIEGTAELVKALEDHIAGFTGAGPDDDDAYFGNATSGTVPYEPMKRGVGETSYYRTMGLQAFTKFIEAETFQVAAQVTTEQIQDLNRQYGIDVVSMVENQLVNEVSQSINKHILSRAFALGWQNNVDFFLVEGKDLNLNLAAAQAYAGIAAGAPGYIGKDGTNLPFPSTTLAAINTFAGATTTFENLGTVQRRIQSRVLAAGNVVAQRGRRGPANFVVTNLQIATALQDSAQFTFYPLANTVNQNNGALYPLGTLAGMTIYVDPNMDYADNRVLVGRKGADEEPGLKFMPYLMAESIQTIAEGTMSPKIAIKSRYALAEAGFHPQTQYFTFWVNTGNANII